jgi:hypothetical protein
LIRAACHRGEDRSTALGAVAAVIVLMLVPEAQMQAGHSNGELVNDVEVVLKPGNEPIPAMASPTTTTSPG